ncbi:hypothetical protein M2444_004333 [Paenibacillus sp. PastF-3]|nr:hypothetical protein [Paenibacillus sp. PastF-3]
MANNIKEQLFSETKFQTTVWLIHDNLLNTSAI